MVCFLDQVTVRNLKSPSLMHCRIASLLKSLILICEWSDKDVCDKKNQGRVRKLEIEEQPGESVAEDCVNWFDLPWESHCGEKCRHSLKKIFLQRTFFFKRRSKVWLILVIEIEHGCSTKHNQNHNDHFRFDSYNISSHRTILCGTVMVCFSIQNLILKYRLYGGSPHWIDSSWT